MTQDRLLDRIVNLLQPDFESSDIENVRHYITVYKGMFLKKADYIVQVSFAGFLGKTKVAKSCTHPEWNEQFSLSWLFPSLCRTFLIQVLANELLQWKCICNFEVHFDDITFPGSFPSFGPSFLHLYDPINTNNYIGRIMISIKTEKLQKHLSPVRCIISRRVPTLSESSFWAVENFVIVGLIWTGDFIQVASSNIKFKLRCGEYCSNLVEAFLHSYKNSSNYKYFKQESPHGIIRLSGFFPDYRLKFEADQILKDLTEIMRRQLYNYKLFEIKYDKNEAVHAKCLRAIISSFQEKVVQERGHIEYSGFKQLTDWDKERIRYITDYLSSLTASREDFKYLLKPQL
ncbi:otoferlin-like [Hermetia illucens]|uniref:otoferlin-like n=1 Tax=Hermetia illucens TaxID=343691 RepID=UPI0018CC4043|nr:otoferlin-like [Hermetia illucens]